MTARRAQANYGESEPMVRKDDLFVERGDEGFMLIVAIVMIFMVLLTLSIAAPRMAKAIQRDREQESAHRAQQYVRAVRIFYLKFKRYPTSIEQLEKTNNQRFLRQRYVDPLTGKADWRVIHVGENLTKVKGFFGDDLPGLPGMSGGGGLGSAAGIQSNLPGAAGAGGGSAFNNSGIGGTGGATGGAATQGGSTGTSTFGQSGTGTSSGAGTGTSSSSGVASQDATSFTGSGGGQIIGVGSGKSGEAMLVVNEQTTYDTWEFLYDPRIEQLYAKGTLLGGIASGSGTSGGFGTPIGSTPASASPSTFGSGSGTATPTAGSPVQP